MTLVVKNHPRLKPRLFSPFDDFFKTGITDWWTPEPPSTVPSVNIRENKNDYQIEMAVPGMKREDFNIDVEGNIMTISCEKESETKEGDDDGFARREYNYSSFSRSFTIPDNAVGEQVKAKYVDGLLRLSIPKSGEGEKDKTRHIKVE